MQRPIKSKIEPISFAAGVTKTRNIPLSVYRKISINMKLNCTFTGAALTIDQLVGILRNIDLTINGNNSIFKCPLSYWYMQNYIKNIGIVSYDITSTNGTRDIFLQFDIPFTVIDGFKAEDSLLDLRNATTAVLKVDFGSSMGTGVVINSGNLFINTYEYVFTGDSATQDVYRTSEVDYITVPLSKTGKTPIKLPTGFDLNYYRILMEVFNSAGARSNLELNEVALQSGNTVFMIKEAARLQQENIVDYCVPTANWIAGQYIMKLVNEGRLTQLLGTQDLPQLDLVLDVAVSGGSVNFYLERVARPMNDQLGIKPMIQAAPAK